MSTVGGDGLGEGGRKEAQSDVEERKDATRETHVSEEVKALLSDEFRRQRNHGNDEWREGVFGVSDGELRSRGRR